LLKFPEKMSSFVTPGASVENLVFAFIGILTGYLPILFLPELKDPYRSQTILAIVAASLLLASVGYGVFAIPICTFIAVMSTLFLASSQY